MKPKKIYEKELYSPHPDDRADWERLLSTFDRDKKEYNCKTIQSGDQLEVQLYETWSTMPAEKKSKAKVSKERKDKLNLRNSQMRAVRLVNANFTRKDSWGSFTYTDKNLPATFEDAERIFKNYLRTVKRRFGKDVKYIYTTEFGQGHVHHHLIINISDRDTLEELWCSRSERRKKRKNPGYQIQKYGRTQARRLQPDDFGLEGMARYITKESKKNKKKFVCSKNLTKPVETKTKAMKGRRITKGFIKKVAEDGWQRKKEFLKAFPHCQLNEVTVIKTPYTDCYYVYAKLKVVESG